MKSYRPCSFRIESEIGEICDVASKPTIYSINPWVCDECTMPYPACEYLEATVLLGEKNTGGVTATVIRARCLKKGIRFNSFTFDECLACDEFSMKMPVSKYDELTGLYMRDYFNKNLRQFYISSNETSPFSLIFFDIDHFKLINDSHGHQTGDIVLKEISSVIKSETGPSGACCRYGGEEIVVLLPSTPYTSAIELAERIRIKIESSHLVNANRNLRVTVSSGISEHPKFNSASETELVEQADKALYRAKEEGRNRTKIYDPYLDSDESSQSVEIDFYGQPTTAKGGNIHIISWIPYPTNLKKIKAVKIEDTRTGIQSYPSKELLDEIMFFPGKSIETPFQGTIESISHTEKRSVFLLKVRKSTFDKITDLSISFFEKQKNEMENNIKFLKRNKNT